MARPLLPPRYVNAPSSLVYSELPKSIIVTGLRIWGLGWKYDYTRSGPISLDRLCAILDLSRTQLYEHLARLVATGVLRYTNIDGQFTFLFERGTVTEGGISAMEARAGPGPENRTDRILSVVDVSSNENLPHDKQQQQTTHSHVVGEECEEGGWTSGKPDGRSEILDAMGIAEPTRSRVLGLEHVTERYLAAWRAWFDAQGELGVGWVITQIRAAADPPGGSRCSDRERHLRRRDSEGAYAKYIKS